MTNQLRGTTKDLPATRFFHLINLAQKTGTYHLYQKTSTAGNPRTSDGKAILKESAKISFERGALIHATSTGSESRLLPVLYKAGKLNQKTFSSYLPKSETFGDKALALLLINANYVTQRDIVQSMRQHMLDVVFSVMARSEETFSFEEGELPPGDSITVWVDIENVVAEGSRRMKELSELSRVVPNLDLVLRFPGVPSAKATSLELSQDEWHVLSLVNARDSIGHIATACHMTETEIRRVVSTLIGAGLVEVVGDEPRKVDMNMDKNGLRKILNKPRSQSAF